MNSDSAGAQPLVRSRAARLARRSWLAVALLSLLSIAGLAAAADKATPSGAPNADAAAADRTGADVVPAGTTGVGTGSVHVGTRKPAPNIERRPEARLVIFNRPVFTFRSAFLGVPADERAEAARHRINQILDRGGEGKVSVEDAMRGAIIKVDDKLAFIISNDDLDLAEGDSLETTTQAAVRALEQAIAETKEARDGRLMTNAAIWAGGATAVYFCVLWVLRLVGRTVTQRMLRLAGSTADHLKVGGTEIIHRERALRVVNFLLRLGFWALVLLVTYEWVGFVLSRFPFTRAWGEELNSFLAETALGILTGMAGAIPDLLIVVVILVIARTVNHLLHNFFDGVQARRIEVDWLDADSARPTRRLVSIGVWIFALVMAYPYIPGSDSEAFKGLSVLIGLMISIGGSGIVGQAASGLILMYTRTYRPGEFVRIADHEGTVVEMGMFTTRMRTGLGEELTLPNSLVLGAVTKNYSRVVKGEGFVLDAIVTIGYDAPWRQVHAMLIQAARRTAGVLSVPVPQVFQTALSDFYVEYRLVCQAVPSDPRPRAQVLSDLHANIQDVFNEHGVQIMSPHYLGDPAENKVVPKENWYAAPAAPPK